MTNEAFQNDDDLFNYDPSTESVNNEPNFSTSSSGTKYNSDILDSISKKFEDDKDIDTLGMLGIRIKFAQSLVNSYTEFIQRSVVPFHKAVHETLDEITNGRFSMIHMYNYLEQNILRRLNIRFLLETAFLDQGNISEQFKEFIKNTKMDLDETFIQVHINTTLDINNHVINNERSLYVELAEKLNRVPLSVITSAEPDIGDVLELTYTSSKSYHQDVFEALFASYSDEQYTQKLSSLYSTEVRISRI